MFPNQIQVNYTKIFYFGHVSNGNQNLVTLVNNTCCLLVEIYNGNVNKKIERSHPIYCRQGTDPMSELLSITPHSLLLNSNKHV